MSLLPALLNAFIVLALAVWAYLVFTTVMDQRREAARRSGQAFAGLREGTGAWLHWLRAPETRGARWRLASATLLLLALLAARAFV